MEEFNDVFKPITTGSDDPRITAKADSDTENNLSGKKGEQMEDIGFLTERAIKTLEAKEKEIKEQNKFAAEISKFYENIPL